MDIELRKIRGYPVHVHYPRTGDQYEIHAIVVNLEALFYPDWRQLLINLQQQGWTIIFVSTYPRSISREDRNRRLGTIQDQIATIHDELHSDPGFVFTTEEGLQNLSTQLPVITLKTILPTSFGLVFHPNETFFDLPMYDLDEIQEGPETID